MVRLVTSSPISAVRDVPRQLRHYAYLLVIVVAASTSLARIMTISASFTHGRGANKQTIRSPMLSANDRSRWCMVWSLEERGTFRIDEILKEPGWYTIDHLYYKDEHFYSTKPPLLQTLVAGLCWVIKQTTGRTLLNDTHNVVHFVLFVVNWLPMLVSLALMVQIAERYARTDWAKLFLVIAAAAGTFLTTFLVTFNNHSVAASCILFSIYAALRILDGERAAWLYLVAGFFASFAGCCELPAFLFALVIFLMLLRASPAEAARFFLPAAVVPLAAHLITNYLETGGLAPFYAYFGTPYYNYELNGKPSYWANPAGIDRGLDSFPVYLLNMVIGHHGILSLSPIFILTVAGWFLLRRKEVQELRGVLMLTAGLTLVTLAFYLTQTKNYNYGGVTSGLRWMFWLIPLWLIGLIPALDRWSEQRWFRWTCAALLAVSVFSASWANNNPWQHPWLFVLLEQWGWINYSG